jgi:GrpB-like predicted nucleotidyltransferase (UPF0157 family)
MPKITQQIEVIPYDTDWPKIFEAEAKKIKKALGDNCITIHHIGSTSVPGLAAKPVIDMIPVVRDILLVDHTNAKMQALGYAVKGEYGMLFRRYFSKLDANIHIYEQDSGEIDRCLKFRDWMRSHPEDKDAYANLKETLAQKFPNDIFNYCSGKDAFVAAIDKKTGFSGLRVVKALTPTEWAFVKKARQKFFDTISALDPYTYTVEHPDHVHFVLYQASEVIGYTHIELLPQAKAVLHMMVIDETKDNKQLDTQFLAFCEKWLKSQGYHIIRVES